MKLITKKFSIKMYLSRVISVLTVLLSLSLVNGFALKSIQSRRSIVRNDMSMLFNFGGGGSSSSIPANKKLCVITGTTSGLGKSTVKALLDQGGYYIICACRDVEKMNQVIEQEGFDKKSLAVVELDLGSFDNTKKFVTRLNNLKKSRPLDVLVCNAAVYQPAFDKVSKKDIFLFILSSCIELNS